jgi:glycosyltransferase involved in cell wall biosynthesis
MGIQLSVVIITFNEEKNIARCIDSVLGVADEIIIIDSFSNDKTKEICLNYNLLFLENKFEGHIEQKNFAISQSSNPYILSLDADECLDDKSRADILAVKNNWTHDGYFFNRLNNYCGHWVRHGGWYPDRKLRLWDSRLGSWQGKNPHDEYRMNINSKIKYLNSNILHYTLASTEDHINQIEYFTTIGAKASFESGVKSSYPKMYLAAAIKFFKDYFIKRGFLDGQTGYQIARLSAWASYLKYKKMFDLQKKSI